MLIGTAGHIDHGKTTLVRALTGVDTDRLPEEKARGISIELGYAYAPLPSGEVLGIIDVPGHERLVRTMVAGACGIDFALLVIAADDGIMPQTREHLEILDLLGVTRGAVALTKIDRATDERARHVDGEIAVLLSSTALAGAPIFPLNAAAPGDPGTERLRRYLHEMAAQCAARRSDQLFRLAVDRVFTLAGHGTIVTGTVFGGRVQVGETVMVAPVGHAVRVRSIHAQGRPAERGCAGQRCAVNLVGIETCAISRGDWLADPRALVPSSRIDVRTRLLSQVGLELRSWSPVHFHSGTAHAVAHAVPLDVERVPAGGLGRVQLVLDSPVCVVPGDRFILRDAQAAQTIGGGVVLDPAAPARKRRARERLRYLDALERSIAGEGLAALLECAPGPLRLSELARLTGGAPEQLELPSSAKVVEAEHQRYVLDRAAWEALRARAIESLRAFHADRSDEPGADVGRLRRMSAPRVPSGLWRRLIDELVQDGAVRRNGPWLHLPEHVATLSPGDEALLQRLEPLIVAGRFDPPWVRELAATVREPEERVRSVLRRRVTRGALHQVVRDLFYGDVCMRELAGVAARLTREHGAVEAAAFRDAVGVGRKRAIQILEFFDQVGVTRRVRDTHVMREDSGWDSTPATPQALRKAHVPGGAAGLQTQKGASDVPW